ncbi:hypothetical protein IAI10_02640 [Clostridium sp. 19966]|uniref:hypothetical protein n=1 Tax=Clostridium sp. 19966 TaxID=2768166 RepID=UPI0028DEBE3A|nr:hypothetical protein [Clostridium sp. 19966]MDT8715557.1 hypothetical protein [Clostridium sp. 19966]
MSKTAYFLIKDVEQHFPGITPYRARMWCKQKKIRFNMAGNRFILREDWLEEDLEKMALENISEKDPDISYGVLRKIKA